MPQALLFDLDGVIVDNTPYQARAFQALFHDLGLTTKALPLLKRLNGMPAPEILQHVFRHSVPAKQLQQYADRREFLYRTLYRAHRREVPGLTAFLTEARAAGFRLALGTGSGEETIAYILDHLKLRHFFEVIIGEEDVRRGKPHPATYLKAAAKLGVAPADCLVFEDAILGEQAARRAGMRCIGVATTLRAADFQQPLAVINDFRELPVARLRALLA